MGERAWGKACGLGLGHRAPQQETSIRVSEREEHSGERGEDLVETPY